MAKPKPKRPSEEQKKTEKVKVELKRRIPQEFQDFAESKIGTNLPPMATHCFQIAPVNDPKTLNLNSLTHKPSLHKQMMITSQLH